MALTQTIPNNVLIQGQLRVTDGLAGLRRTDLDQEDYAKFALPPQLWRVWDAFATLPPGTSASDDLGVYAGVFGTGNPYLATSDMKTLGSVSRYARTFFQLPPSYVAGQSVRLAATAGMKTAVADVAATLDFECFKAGLDTLVSGSDLVSTAAQSINSLVFAAKNFEVTAITPAPGDWLDIRATVLVNDAAGASAVIAALAAVELQLDIKG